MEKDIVNVNISVGHGGMVNLADGNAQINVNRESNENKNIQHVVNSRTQEYADIWDKNMFLNNFNELDENAGVNVKLSDVYLDGHLPHFIWKNNSKESDKLLKDLLSGYINEHNDKKMLLILGQPGIGKSTLITWIAAKYADKRENILVYKFAADLQNIDWLNTNKDGNFIDDIIKKLNLSYESLNGKTLIIDGFDEISVGSDRADILNNIYRQLKENTQLKDFSLIITCRENYIKNLQQLSCDYITLQPWDEEQIRSFCTVYSNKARTEISEITIANIIKNNQVLGIPLILYMVLALNISIGEENSIVDVYDKIFALEGGIYDRCIDNESYSSPHRISQIKKQVHQISREIAFWMFENEPDEAIILYEDYQKICNMVVQDSQYEKEFMEQNVMIGSYFKRIRHCEGIGTEEISFVHRTIYEYFVAEMIYNSMEDAMIELSDQSQMEFAGNIAWFLKRGELTYTIREYLQHKILKLYDNLNSEKKLRFYEWWENAVGNMMNNGMFFYTKENIQNLGDVIRKDLQCFLNLIGILYVLSCLSEKKYILTNVDRKIFEKYIKHCSAEFECVKKENKKKNKEELRKFFLYKIDLNNTDLIRIDLCFAQLHFANFKDAKLLAANLLLADLPEADLRCANFTKADLKGVNLRGADLRGTIFKKASLFRVDLREAKLGGVILEGTDLRCVNWGDPDLLGVNINASIWLKNDVNKMKPRLREAEFEYIIIEEHDIQKKVSKNKLFSDLK